VRHRLVTAPATAAPADRQAVLSSWTQKSVTGHNAWLAAQQNRPAWAAYGFDRSTDDRTTSLDSMFSADLQRERAAHAAAGTSPTGR
jgi:hypothetical protein